MNSLRITRQLSTLVNWTGSFRNVYTRGLLVHKLSTGSAFRATNEAADIVNSPWGSVTVPDNLTMPDMVLDAISKAPQDKPAIISSPTGETVTYGELGDKIRSLATSLSKHGVGPGDRLLVFSPSTLEMALLIVAVPATGACVATINPTLSKGDVEALLERGPMDYLVTVPQLFPIFANKFSTFKKVFTIGENLYFKSVRQLIMEGNPSQMPNVKINPLSDPALIVYSSGTTGLPKGIVHSHHSLVSSNIALSFVTPDCAYFDSDDIIVNILPLALIGGSVLVLQNCLLSHATVVIPPSCEFTTFLQEYEKHKGTIMLLPAHVGIQLLNDSGCVGNYNLSSLRKIISGGASISKHVQEGLINKLGLISFRQIYGMTETGATHIDDKVNYNNGSAGMPVPNCSVKVVDPATGLDLPSSSTGEICLKTPQTMLGYLNNPQATAEMMLPGGWVRTGDIGYNDGVRLFITDRYKELIKYKDLHVAPAELEAVILQHPLVRDAGVIGVPDNKAGEVPKAFIVLQESIGPTMSLTETEKSILKYVADRVAPYKKLRGGVTFVKDIPKLPSGKILRRVLKQMASRAGIDKD